MPKTRFLVVVAVALGILSYGCVALGADSHAAPYLRMGVGARALGMGGAFTAIADDATAAYWNPAGLVKIEHIEATFMYAANMSVEQLGQHLGLDSLAYLSLNGLLESTGVADPEANFCKACFDGCYPVSFDEDLSKDCLEG